MGVLSKRKGIIIPSPFKISISHQYLHKYNIFTFTINGQKKEEVVRIRFRKKKLSSIKIFSKSNYSQSENFNRKINSKKTTLYEKNINQEISMILFEVNNEMNFYQNLYSCKNFFRLHLILE